MKTSYQQIVDARWYLGEIPQGVETDADKAKAILDDWLTKNKPEGEEEIPDVSPGDVEFPHVKGIEIAVMAGHQPGGGTENERDWNTRMTSTLADLLADSGATVYHHEHLIEDYGPREDEMAIAVNRALPNCKVCCEFHYNGFSDPSANGHEFHYLGSKPLAEAFSNRWQQYAPSSKARKDNGIYHNTGDAGFGFLDKAPGWAQLTEPFFRSNEEWERYRNKQDEVAFVYAQAINDFCATL